MGVLGMIDRAISTVQGGLGIAQHGADPAEIGPLHRLSARAYDMAFVPGMRNLIDHDPFDPL